MAKPKRSSADLDAELAALEAELAALEQRKGKPAPRPQPTAEPAPAPEAPKAEPAPAPAEPQEKKPRFGLKLPKREKAAEPAPAKEARAPPPPPEPRFDASAWRQEEGAWVRTVPGAGVVVRRVLDEKGEIVREEPATPRDLEDEPMRAERGIGRLLRRKGK